MADVSTRERRAGVPFTVAITIGAAIGPLLGWAVAVARLPGLVAAAAFSVLLLAVGVAGLARTVSRWRRAARATGGGEAEAARFRTAGQRGSLALAVALLTIAVLCGGLYLLAAIAGPATGPAAGLPQLLVVALAGVLAGACVVPVVLLQLLWTREPVALAEAAVLAGRLPGRRALIRRARIVALVAWSLATSVALVVAAGIVLETVERGAAVTGAYSAGRTAADVRTQLGGDGYLVADVRCPAGIGTSLFASTIRCSLTTLGAPRTVAVQWTPDGYGNGDATVLHESSQGLRRAADLPDRPPTVVPPVVEISGARTVAIVRAQLRREGWGAGSLPMRELSCPGIGVGYDGFIRCDVGRGAASRSLDVYPVARNRVVARTSELADLPR